MPRMLIVFLSEEIWRVERMMTYFLVLSFLLFSFSLPRYGNYIYIYLYIHNPEYHIVKHISITTLLPRQYFNDLESLCYLLIEHFP